MSTGAATAVADTREPSGGSAAIDSVLAITGDATDGARATEWLGVNGLPDPSAEMWRYTPLGDIAEALAGVSAAGAAPDATSTAELERLDVAAGRHGRFRIVFVDGRYVPELSDRLGTESDGAHDPLPPGVTVEADTSKSPSRTFDPSQHGTDDGFEVLNATSPGAPAVISVPAGVAVGCPIQVVHIRTSPEGSGSTLAQPTTLVTIADGASAQVIESHVSDGAGVTNALTRITVGVSGHLTHIRTQDDGPDAVHVAQTTVELAEGAHLESASLSVGARVARNGLTVRLEGEHASAHLSGLSILGSTQRHDTVLSIDHSAPNCRSDQDFRSVVDDRARSSFCGHVSVAHGAVGTDASQSNRNLLLSRTAQADTRPWLEILADDVKCNHGATVGRLDDEALFYLRSRGVPEARARSMLIGAFAAEITDRLEPESVRHALDEAIAALDPTADRTGDGAA